MPGRNESLGASAVLVFAILVAIGFSVVAWVVGDEDTEIPIGATLGEVAAEPGEHVGERVSVVGQIGEIVTLEGSAPGPKGSAFTLAGGDADAELLVVRPGADVRFLDAEDRVKVFGTVRTFERERFAGAFDEGIDFDAPLFDRWEGRPAIVADGVDPTVPFAD